MSSINLARGTLILSVALRFAPDCWKTESADVVGWRRNGPTIILSADNLQKATLVARLCLVVLRQYIRASFPNSWFLTELQHTDVETTVI